MFPAGSPDRQLDAIGVAHDRVVFGDFAYKICGGDCRFETADRNIGTGMSRQALKQARVLPSIADDIVSVGRHWNNTSERPDRSSFSDKFCNDLLSFCPRECVAVP